MKNYEELKPLINTLVNKVLAMNFYQPAFKAMFRITHDGITLSREGYSFPWTYEHTCYATEPEHLMNMIEWLDQRYDLHKRAVKNGVPPDAEPEHLRDLEESIRRRGL